MATQEWKMSERTTCPKCGSANWKKLARYSLSGVLAWGLTVILFISVIAILGLISLPLFFIAIVVLVIPSAIALIWLLIRPPKLRQCRKCKKVWDYTEDSEVELSEKANDIVYISETLPADERLIHCPSLHRAMFFVPSMVLISLLLLSGLILLARDNKSAFVILLMAVTPIAITTIRYKTSEFAVTNKRIIFKAGILNNSVHEISLAKIITIELDQSLFGKLFNYGAVTIIGTGGSRLFTGIREPLEFRRAVQQQLAPQ